MVVKVPCDHKASQALAQSEVMLIVVGVGNSPGPRRGVRGCSHTIITCNLRFQAAIAPSLWLSAMRRLHPNFSFSEAHNYLFHSNWLSHGLIWICFSVYMPWAPSWAQVPFHHHTCPTRALAWALTVNIPGLYWWEEQSEEGKRGHTDPSPSMRPWTRLHVSS